MRFTRCRAPYVLGVCVALLFGLDACQMPSSGRLTTEAISLSSYPYQATSRLPQISEIKLKALGRVGWSGTFAQKGNTVKYIGFINTVSTVEGRVRVDQFIERMLFRSKLGRTREVRLGALQMSSVEYEPNGMPYRINVAREFEIPTGPPSPEITQVDWTEIRPFFLPASTIRITTSSALFAPMFPVGPVSIGTVLTPQTQADLEDRAERYLLPAFARGGVIPELSWKRYIGLTHGQRREFARVFSKEYFGFRSDANVRGSVFTGGLEYLWVTGSSQFSAEGKTGNVEIEWHIDPYSGLTRYWHRTGRVDGIEVESEMLVDLPATVPRHVAANVLRPEPVAPSSPGSISQVYDRAVTSVVTVVVDDSIGSGFLVRDGYVVTNRHVVKDSDKIVLLTASGQNIPAHIVKLGPGRLDLALLRPASRISVPALPLLNEIPITGSQALVIGSPLGVLIGTLTTGVVGSVRRDQVVSFVQIDAAINPGNSGGPVLNTLGQVIAVATFGLWSEDARLVGLNFGISSIDVIAFLEQARTATAVSLQTKLAGEF